MELGLRLPFWKERKLYPAILPPFQRYAVVTEPSPAPTKNASAFAEMQPLKPTKIPAIEPTNRAFLNTN